MCRHRGEDAAGDAPDIAGPQMLAEHRCVDPVPPRRPTARTCSARPGFTLREDPNVAGMGRNRILSR